MISDVQVWAQELARADIPPMRARGPVAEDFRARLSTTALGPVRLAELATPGGECFRDESRVRERDQEFCQLYLTVHGHTRLEQNGRSADLEVGDLAVVDPARPLRVVTTDTRYLTVLVPRRLLGIEANDLARLSGERIPGTQGSAALLAALARTAIGSAGEFDPEEAARSGVAVAELTTALLAARLPRARYSPDEALRSRIRAFVAARLPDPGLNPATVAAAHHVSVRRLHQLFQREPRTVAALIRHSRLERCRAELAAEAHRHRTVAAVAARWGFTDPAYFSRLFRSVYGCTASEHRRNALISN
ncbi:AraC-like ligand-binding domain-containing protein [Kineosporia babensis]|uniref:Helix-turn-helix domain-containing protein n=1 Tax=Kineosporia babensis TaxID=499548 RepID=A0A9X1NCI3_9ACTN|nr:helix-turn-helix domain-containing protein [Kineosporia babensis]